MKLRNVGRVLLALVVSCGLGIGVTSCSRSYTVAYMYVTGQQYNQISGFNVNNQTGKLTPVKKSPFGSSGTNPIRALVLSGGRFLYVLNEGNFTYNSDGTSTGTASNVALFQIGGSGTLTFQASYSSQGSNSLSILADAAGAHLYILDNYATLNEQPIASTATATANTPCLNSTDGRYYPTGDISAYSIDPNTGRLSLITNQQVASPVGAGQLTYFPIGCSPTEFKLTGGYIFTIQQGSTSNNDVQSVFSYAQSPTNGQLTLTQNAPLLTGAAKLTYINTDPASKYVYLLDAGPQAAGANPLAPATACTGGQTQIMPFTVGSGGILQSLVGGNVCNDPTAVDPVFVIADSKSKFLYIANTGNTNLSQAFSEITAFTIDPTTGKLLPIGGQPFKNVASGPRCMLEDPSNQFIYTAGFNDSTVVGTIIDTNAGTLTPLRVATSYATSGNPTWCVASGRTQ